MDYYQAIGILQCSPLMKGKILNISLASQTPQDNFQAVFPLFFQKDKAACIRHLQKVAQDEIAVYPKVTWKGVKKRQNITFQFVAHNLSQQTALHKEIPAGFFRLQGIVRKVQWTNIPVLEVWKNPGYLKRKQLGDQQIKQDLKPTFIPLLWKGYKPYLNRFVSVRTKFIPHLKAWGVRECYHVTDQLPPAEKVKAPS